MIFKENLENSCFSCFFIEKTIDFIAFTIFSSDFIENMQVLHSKFWFSYIPICLQAQFSWMRPLGLWDSPSGLYPGSLFWWDLWSDTPWSLTIASTISWGVQGSLGQSSIAFTNSHEIMWLACSLGSSLWSFLVWSNSLESPPHIICSDKYLHMLHLQTCFDVLAACKPCNLLRSVDASDGPWHHQVKFAYM